MMNKQSIVIVLIISALMLGASSVTAVEFEWAQIGNAGNDADDTGYGSVEYDYSISTTEVTTAQYVEFLNAVAATDTYGLYNTNMTNSTYYQGIVRVSGGNGWEYSINGGEDGEWANRPVVFVSWYDALRFVNWMHNGQVTGAQDINTTEYGVYDMLQGTTATRLSGAQYWLPSENEWYKAAYYDSDSGLYYDYATGTDTQSDNNAPDDDTGNSANYYNNGYTMDGPYYSTEVGAYTLSESPYGTYDQGGNVWEWTDTLVSGQYHVLRGGSWWGSGGLASDVRVYDDSSNEYVQFGFRVASIYTEDAESIPEPISLGLMILGVVGLVLRRVRKA